MPSLHPQKSSAGSCSELQRAMSWLQLLGVQFLSLWTWDRISSYVMYQRSVLVSTVLCLTICKIYCKGTIWWILWLPSKGNKTLYAAPKILTGGENGKDIILFNFLYSLQNIFWTQRPEKKKFSEVLAKTWKTAPEFEEIFNSTGGEIIYWFSKTWLTAVASALGAKSIPSAQSSRQLLFMRWQKKSYLH